MFFFFWGDFESPRQTATGAPDPIEPENWNPVKIENATVPMIVKNDSKDPGVLFLMSPELYPKKYTILARKKTAPNVDATTGRTKPSTAIKMVNIGALSSVF